MRRLIGEPRFRQCLLGADDALSDRRLRHQKRPGDLFRRQAADHPQGQRYARLARNQRMTGREDQAQHFVADIVIERGVEIRHDLLVLLHLANDHLVFVVKHPAAAQVIERPTFSRCHQPRAGALGDARFRPSLQRRNQCFLSEILGQRHIAQQSRQAGDQPRLLDPPDGKDRPMGAGDRQGRLPR